MEIVGCKINIQKSVAFLYTINDKENFFLNNPI